VCDEEVAVQKYHVPIHDKSIVWFDVFDVWAGVVLAEVAVLLEIGVATDTASAPEGEDVVGPMLIVVARTALAA